MTKFAIQTENQIGYDWESLKKIILDTEKYGFDAFYTCDHFFLNQDSANRHSLDTYIVQTAGAMITERINFGTLVTGNNFRNPALLAKIFATLYHISGGRAEFGIGTGWKQIEYEAYGYDFPSVKDRCDMLEESVQIIRKLFSEEAPSFEGKHYRIKNANFSPRPDNPLFLIGGSGEKRTLKLVAQYADYCNLGGFDSLEVTQRKLEALKNHCKAVGRDYEEVGKSMFTPMRVYETEEAMEEGVKIQAQMFKMPLEDLKKRLQPENVPGSWFGTPEMIRDRIEFCNSLGFDYYFFQQPFDQSTDEIRKFGEGVLKKYYN